MPDGQATTPYWIAKSDSPSTAAAIPLPLFEYGDPGAMIDYEIGMVIECCHLEAATAGCAPAPGRHASRNDPLALYGSIIQDPRC